MHPDIPQEQLGKIQPIIDELQRDLAILIERLPLEQESALRFHPDAGLER